MITRQLWVGDRAVAEYVTRPDVDPRLSPRPYLHPVRTLAGATVSDVLPDDHPHHLGVSLGIQDVDKTNLWGGRTYVRGSGYTWLDDHGTISHEGFDGDHDHRLIERLCWRDPSGDVLLTERRRLATHGIPDLPSAWALDVEYELAAPPERDIVLGSPATNGRPSGAGYGGFFWRVAPSAESPLVFTSSEVGEDKVNGSAEPWLCFATGAFTLVFTGLDGADRWFVRTAAYPGVCVALAFERPLTIDRGTALRRRHAVLVADGTMSRADATHVAVTLRERCVLSDRSDTLC